ncbi:MAG TPA: hypothetical protein VE687_03155 [Stellaceae bacterium]|nr:hypothetical protein [Stellaceae bacterium]
MADRIDPPSGVMGQGEAVGRSHATAPTDRDQVGTVVSEFLNAARSAAESVLDEQKRQVADKAAGVAEALRGAVDPLYRSQNRIVARYVEQAASGVEGFSGMMRNRRWSEIVEDTEAFARRQPTWFVLGAVVTGFLLGRLLWAADDSEQRPDTSDASPALDSTEAVTAAVSSGTGTEDAAGYSAGTSGAMEAR